jgi:hypothetical protein
MLYSSDTLSEADKSPPWSGPFGKDMESVMDTSQAPDQKESISTTEVNDTNGLSININLKPSSPTTINKADEINSVWDRGKMDSLDSQIHNAGARNETEECSDSNFQGEIPLTEVNLDLNGLMDQSTTVIE